MAAQDTSGQVIDLVHSALTHFGLNPASISKDAWASGWAEIQKGNAVDGLKMIIGGSAAKAELNKEVTNKYIEAEFAKPLAAIKLASERANVNTTETNNKWIDELNEASIALQGAQGSQAVNSGMGSLYSGQGSKASGEGQGHLSKQQGNRFQLENWVLQNTLFRNSNMSKAEADKDADIGIKYAQQNSMNLSNIMMTGVMQLMGGLLSKFLGINIPAFDMLGSVSGQAMNAGTSPNGNTQAVAKVKNPLDNKDFMAIDPKYDIALKAALKGNTKDLMAIQNGTKGHQLTFLNIGNKDGREMRMIENKTLIEKYDVKPDSKSPNAWIMQNGKWAGVDITQKANETVRSIATAPSVVKKTAAVVTEAVTPTKANPEENQPIPLRQLPQLQMQKPA
jgi:hypothetical protein